MSYIVFKTIGGKKHYLSTSGKWIKTAALASCFDRDRAAEKAKEVGASIRVYRFRD